MICIVMVLVGVSELFVLSWSWWVFLNDLYCHGPLGVSE